MNLPKIFIGVPTRNHAWALPKYLDAVLDLDYPKDKINIYFLVNDSPDGTFEILETFREKYSSDYCNVENEEINYGNLPDKREAGYRYILYPKFAVMKNHVKAKFLESGCDFWLQVDTDTIIKKDTLNLFLRHDKGYVCGTCSVDISGGYGALNVLKRDANGEYKRVSYEALKSAKGLLKVSWVGGIAFIRKDIAAKCNYHVVDKKRDDTLGFCQDIEACKGKSVWVDPEVFLEHMMVRS